MVSDYTVCYCMADTPFPFFSFCILALPDIVPDIDVLRRDMRLSIVPMQYLRCPLEENCLSDSAGYVIR